MQNVILPLLRIRVFGLGLEMASLDDTGLKEAKECAPDMRLRGAEIIVSSPYTRALQTAAYIAQKTPADIKLELDLREVDIDKNYSYRSIAELKEMRGSAMQCEKTEEAANRAGKVLEKYEKYKKVIVVTHGDLLRTLIGDRHIDNCEIIEYHL